jgi:GT2 family glycosyltransferase
MIRVSIMITTKNRANDLERTCRAIKLFQPLPIEVLLTADSCTDRTVELISNEFSDVTLFVNERPLGSVASRDRMIRSARGDLVLALDDDSYPEEKDCIARIIAPFEANPKLAVLHFPQRSDEYPATVEQEHFGPERLTRSFPNSGAVLRRSTYLQLPGFEPRFFHMYEEPDYALQCIAGGYEVLFTPVITIRHHYSGQSRSEMRNHHLHSRNELWSIGLRCPFPYAIALALYRVMSQFGYACKRGINWVVHEPVWWWSAIVGLPWVFRKRQPVQWAGYKKWLSLS